ncbi:MAG TPA: KUP/HAK/KT family potassium transporter [Acidimicrobiales bacterium]|nr:KUP/HAK/KT family potassium transporter [Acidimicrobiales bacterium]
MGGDGAHPGSPGVGLAAPGALGIVYGDIGTSPLSSMQTVFSTGGGVVRPTPTDVLGVVSLVFWSIAAVVAAKYLGIVLRADDQGEGACSCCPPSPAGRWPAAGASPPP